jgi:DivIVA domain-containing protein
VQGRSTADRIRSKTFPQVLRGYDRAAVDAWLVELADLVERLEAQPPPRDAAVKRALDEVGQETAGILQRAHDAAEEIEARSRAQAEGRLQRAEGEAQQTVAQAEERAQRLEADTRRLWDERTRLLEEMRQFADEVLGVADDAIERLSPSHAGEPEPEADRPAAFEAISELREELEAGEQPTVEVEVTRVEAEQPEPGEQPGSAPDAGITRT